MSEREIDAEVKETGPATARGQGFEHIFWIVWIGFAKRVSYIRRLDNGKFGPHILRQSEGRVIRGAILNSQMNQYAVIDDMLLEFGEEYY